MNLLECWRQFVFDIIREGVAVSWQKQLVVSQLNAVCETSQFYASLPTKSWPAIFSFSYNLLIEDGLWIEENLCFHYDASLILFGVNVL